MGRTRLRGLEIAGIQIGIEVPESCPWEWPESPIAEFQCLPREPEVHVGLRMGTPGDGDLGGERYSVGPWIFEVARCGRDWLLGLSRRSQRIQLAVFDADFEKGEIVISPDHAGRSAYPLRGPLDEWIVLHRTVARGGLCLDAGVERRGDGHVILRLGASTEPVEGRWTTASSSLLGRNASLVREVRGHLRLFGTPFHPEIERRVGREARIEELLRVEPAMTPYRQALDPDEAADALIRHAVVPLCDEGLLDRVLRNARHLARTTPVFELGELSEQPAPMAWRSTQLQGAFAPPGQDGR
jgi:hypothetical protein